MYRRSSTGLAGFHREWHSCEGVLRGSPSAQQDENMTDVQEYMNIMSEARDMEIIARYSHAVSPYFVICFWVQHHAQVDSTPQP